MTPRPFLAACAALIASAVWVGAQNAQVPAPKSLEIVDEPHGSPWEGISSGGPLAVDQYGNRLAEPAAPAVVAPAVALDRRVSSNIRLGDDPAALPAGMRAQAEPHITRSPVDPDFLVATFQEGRFTDGSAVNCGYSVSRDGGLTWTRTLIPGLTPSSGGPYPRATDPVAAIDLNGYAYLNTLAAGSATRAGTILVNRSTDGGTTFGNPIVAYQAPSVDIFPDKNWITTKSFPGTPTAGRIVVTFTRFPRPNTAGSTPIMRVYSDNAGLTWSPAALIHSTTMDTQGSQPVFLPDGKLAIVYHNSNRTVSTADDFFELVVSNDGGGTFGTPRLITRLSVYDHPQIRDGAILPSATADRVTGNLYVVYQAIHNGVPRIMFTKSPDAGSTWTAPIPVSDNPTGSGVFTSAIASSPDGQTLTVVFYSTRDNPGSSTLVDAYLAQSLDGGATWHPNIRLTPVSTDAALAPLTPAGYMLGDYIAIAGSTNVNVPAVPVWIDTRTGNPDPFVTRVGIAAQLSFTSWQAARFSLGQINNPALGGEGGDADGDLEDNLSEYRSGTEPNDPLSVFRTGRQLNLSTRTEVLTGDNVLIGGFIVTGNSPKKVILRALGPSLVATGVAGRLDDPTLELIGGGVSLASNDNWRESQQAEIENSGIPPADEREAAIVRTLAPGDYTAVVRGRSETTGVALVEMYDLEQNTAPRLANVSSRGFVGTDEGVMIGGFIVGAGQGKDGAGSARVVLRGIGPSLGQAGTAGALQDPELLLFDANGSILASNDNWWQTQQAELEASGIAPTDEREAALIIALPQGSYTAILRGTNRTTGVGLVEAYNVQ